MHDERQDFALTVASDACLLGAGTSLGHGIDGLEVAGIRHQVNADLAAAAAGENAGRADVVFHVATAKHAARVHVFESGENFCRRAVHNVDDHVEATAVTHREYGLLGTVLGGGVQNFVEEWDQRGIAFERVTLGSDVTRVDGLLEDVGAHELVEYAGAIDRQGLFRLHALLHPATALGIGNVHELGADGAAINAPRGVRLVPRDFEIGMSQGGEMACWIEIGLQKTPAAERVHDAFQLLAVNIHQNSGQV